MIFSKHKIYFLLESQQNDKRTSIILNFILELSWFIL